jgi:DNA-directed RNA polymerase specialized sigma24 family protein
VDADLDRLAQAQEAAGTHAGDSFQPHAAPDPEQTLARNEAARALHGALARALAAFADEDRLLVRLYYFDGLRLREAGAVLGVHEATASRRLTRIHAAVREQVAAVLAKDYGWTRQEIARSLTDAAHDLDADIGRLLTPEAAPAERREELYE